VTEAAGMKSAKRGFPWRKAVRALISFAVVAAIFGFAVPKFASYSDVWPILAVAAGASHSAAVAGDLVFRTLTYLLPIPVGGITYVIWRRKKSWLKPGRTRPQSSM
jgi:hypothetical protein